MAPRSVILFALGALAVEANMLLPRAGKDAGLDDSIFSICSTEVPAQTKSYEGCYTSAMLAVGACTGSPEACGCSLYTAIAKTCIPIVCPTALASSLLSVGCEALIGATATATGGGSAKPTSAAGTAKTGGGASGSGTANTGSGGSVFSTAAPTGGAATTGGGSSGTDTGSGSGSGSGSGGSSAGGNNNNGSPQTTSSRALAGDMAVPVVGGAIAGLVGALAVLL